MIDDRDLGRGRQIGDGQGTGGPKSRDVMRQLAQQGVEERGLAAAKAAEHRQAEGILFEPQPLHAQDLGGVGELQMVRDRGQGIDERPRPGDDFLRLLSTCFGEVHGISRC